ncbi:hypothetical protein ABZT27_18520 [Streptomyces sp. NPDC005389]|uniref:hypothetical protein n=1 Tax=Streptomyces sp. NPDC005389 TaxID=3157040 RepID=UPI0033BF47C9
MARGGAHELSGYALGTWITVTGLILGTFPALSLSFRASARDRTGSHNGDYVLVFTVAEVVALVLGRAAPHDGGSPSSAARPNCGCSTR